MTSDVAVADETPTLSFEEFWAWIVRHPNCILRAGAQDAVLYDDEDFHWHFASEGADTALVQVIRGKRLVGELLIATERVAFVQGTPGDVDGEHLFDLVVESENERLTAWFFVVTHGYETSGPRAESTIGSGHSVH
jgi:hypothetical protein